MNILATQRRNQEGEVDYQCPRGHRVHGENILWRRNGNGNEHPGCRECRRAYKKDHRKKSEVKARELFLRRKNAGPAVYDSRGIEFSLEEYLGLEKRSVPWNLLRPRAEASAAWDEFNEALKYTDVPCRGREVEFTEYRDPRPTRDDDPEGRLPMPSREAARRLCAGCPLFDACKTYAHLEKPDFGIHAAERWLGGKVV